MKKTQTGTRRPRRDAEAWAGLVAAGEESDLSIKEFCAAQDVSPASYYRWRQLLGQEEEAVFHPIEIQTRPVGGIVVELPGGVLLRFSELPPVGYLRSLSSTFNGHGL